MDFGKRWGEIFIECLVNERGVLLWFEKWMKWGIYVLIWMVNDSFVLFLIYRGCDRSGVDRFDIGDGGDEVDW